MDGKLFDLQAATPGGAVEPAGMAETPEWIGDYKVIKELGRGAMGVVYLAEHPSLGRQMALKVMARELSMDPAFLERFRREGQAAAKLRHPNIVQVFDFAQRDGVHFIAMEYLGAQTVKDLLDESGHLTVDRACGLMDDLLSALALAHGKGIIHRDIKPANIMLTDDGAAALTDFSIAHMKETSKLTQTGAIVGTPEYMAPEQFDGHWDARSDLYSAGLVFYELLTGISPFRAKTISEVMRNQLFKVPEPPCLLETDVPEPLSCVVSKVLEKEPDSRYQSATEMRLAIKAALDKTSTTPDVASKVEVVPPPPSPDTSQPPPSEATLTGVPKDVAASSANPAQQSSVPVAQPAAPYLSSETPVQPLAPLRRKSEEPPSSTAEPETAVNQPKVDPTQPPPGPQQASASPPNPVRSGDTTAPVPIPAPAAPTPLPEPLREQEISRRKRHDRTRSAGQAGSLLCIILAGVLWYRLNLVESAANPSPSATTKPTTSPTQAVPTPTSPAPKPVYTPPDGDNDDPPPDDPEPDYPPGGLEMVPEFPMSGVISPGRTVGDVALGTGKEKVKALWGPPDKGVSANGLTRWDYAGTGEQAACTVLFSTKGVVEIIALGDSRFSIAGNPNCRVGAHYDTVLDSFSNPSLESPQYLVYSDEGILFGFQNYICNGVVVFGRGRELSSLQTLRSFNSLR